MESVVKQRLIEYLKYKRISKSEFGKSIGVSNSYVTAIRKSIDDDKMKSIALVYPDLNRDWLLYGEGEMLKSEPPKPAIVENSTFDRLLSIIESQQRTIENLTQKPN